MPTGVGDGDVAVARLGDPEPSRQQPQDLSTHGPCATVHVARDDRVHREHVSRRTTASEYRVRYRSHGASSIAGLPPNDASATARGRWRLRASECAGLRLFASVRNGPDECAGTLRSRPATREFARRATGPRRTLVGMGMEHSPSAFTSEQLAGAWRNAAAQLAPEFVVVDRFGPSTYMTLQGGSMHGRGVEGQAGVWWTPWAVLARRRNARSKDPSLCHAPLGTPDDMRSIGRILARGDGVIVFNHPSGPAFALIEDRLVQSAELDGVDHAKWLADSGLSTWMEHELH